MTLSKIGFMTVVFIAFLAMGVGIVNASDPQVLEYTPYGTTSYDGFYEIIPNGNGGYVCAGAQHNGWGDPTSLYNVWLINFDEDNSIIWEKTYDLGYLDSAQTIIRDSDGGFITGGWSSNSLNLLKVNSNGNEIWRKRYTAGAYSVINDIQKSGPYYYAGGAFYDQPYVFRFDNSNGNLLWNVSTYAGRGEILSLVPAVDDTCIFVGYVGLADDVVIGKVNPSGTILWKKILNKQDKDYGYAIDKLLDGTYIVAAYADREDITNAATWIMNIDEGGNILWEKIIDGPQYNGPLDVTATSDGGFIIAGFKDFTSPYTGDIRAATGEAWIIKFDSAFNEQWNLTAGGNKSDDARSIIEIGDNLYRFAGATRSYGSGYTDGWVVKIGGGITNQPPVADIEITPDEPIVEESATFSGRGSYDPDGYIESYAWVFGDGSTGSGVTCSHTYSLYGNKDVTLTVIDNEGLPDSETFTIKVLARPVAVIGPNIEIIVGETATFDGSDSYDPDGSIATYAWDFNSDLIPDSTDVSLTKTYDTAGEYYVTLIVTDNDGITGADAIKVTVLSPEGAAENLIGDIIDLNLPNEFDNGQDIETGLLDKLEAAIESLESGNYNAALGQLNSFKNLVKAQRGKTLTNEEADALIEYADRIIASISSSTNHPPTLSNPKVEPFNPLVLYSGNLEYSIIYEDIDGDRPETIWVNIGSQSSAETTVNMKLDKILIEDNPFKATYKAIVSPDYYGQWLTTDFNKYYFYCSDGIDSYQTQVCTGPITEIQGTANFEYSIKKVTDDYPITFNENNIVQVDIYEVNYRLQPKTSTLGASSWYEGDQKSFLVGVMDAETQTIPDDYIKDRMMLSYELPQTHGMTSTGTSNGHYVNRLNWDCPLAFMSGPESECFDYKNRQLAAIFSVVPTDDLKDLAGYAISLIAGEIITPESEFEPYLPPHIKPINDIFTAAGIYAEEVYIPIFSGDLEVKVNGKSDVHRDFWVKSGSIVSIDAIYNEPKLEHGYYGLVAYSSWDSTNPLMNIGGLEPKVVDMPAYAKSFAGWENGDRIRSSIKIMMPKYDPTKENVYTLRFAYKQYLNLLWRDDNTIPKYYDDSTPYEEYDSIDYHIHISQ